MTTLFVILFFPVHCYENQIFQLQMSCYRKAQIDLAIYRNPLLSHADANKVGQ